VAIAGGYSPRAYRHEAEIRRSAAGVTSRQKVAPITPVRPGDTAIIGERCF
jgi:polysaccharide export outer membrane protein